MADLDSLLEKALAESHVRSPSGAIVVALHCKLLEEGFECVAIGDENFGVEKTTSSTVKTLSSKSSPGLPTGWNDDQDMYALQYRAPSLSSSSYLAKVIPLGETVIVSALSSSHMDQPLTVTLSLTDVIRWDESQKVSPSTCIFRKPLQLFSTIDKEIVSKLKEIPQKQSTSTKAKPSNEGHHDPLMVSPPHHRHHYPPPHQPWNPDPFAVGTGDLSPFGVGGGMLMDPMRQGRSGFGPHGSFPPAPRFDPVAPFGPGSHPGWMGGRGSRGGGGGLGGGPDPDHLPLPGRGYDDDMFS